MLFSCVLHSLSCLLFLGWSRGSCADGSGAPGPRPRFLSRLLWSEFYFGGFRIALYSSLPSLFLFLIFLLLIVFFKTSYLSSFKFGHYFAVLPFICKLHIPHENSCLLIIFTTLQHHQDQTFPPLSGSLFPHWFGSGCRSIRSIMEPWVVVPVSRRCFFIHPCIFLFVAQSCFWIFFRVTFFPYINVWKFKIIVNGMKSGLFWALPHWNWSKANTLSKYDHVFLRKCCSVNWILFFPTDWPDSDQFFPAVFPYCGIEN